MTLTQDQPVRPWGMSRATPPLPEADPLWVSTHLDPETQLTIFSGEQGKPVVLAAAIQHRSTATQPYYAVRLQPDSTAGPGKG
jgi:putative ATP-grasp target RiPP